jgi:SAM-dependent methyltransferase
VILPPESYGQAWAAVYDEVHGSFDPTPAVDLLASLARGGRVLELGIGTGRVAIPLAARGIDVCGIDASEAMVAQMRAKPGGAAIPTTIGDFSHVAVDGEFSLICVVFNTIFALLTPELQQACFANVAKRLAPGGVFVVEAFVPDVGRFDRGQRVNVDRIEAERVDLSVAQYDAASQRITAQTIRLVPGSVELRPIVLRLAWPSELDLMAQLAGLRLRDRWANWDGSRFTGGSQKHISVYAR